MKKLLLKILLLKIMLKLETDDVADFTFSLR